MRDRGATEVIGYVMVFSLVLGMVTVVTVAGMPTLQTAQEAQQTENAKAAMNILSDNVEDVYSRGAPSRATEIDLHQARLTTGEDVDINVTLTDTSDPTRERTEEWHTTPLIYEGQSGTTIVYEAGALFLVQGSGGLVEQESPFVVQLSGGTERVSLPIVQLTSFDADSVGGTTTHVRTGAASTSRPSVWFHRTGGTSYDKINVTIDSPRHELWARQLRGEFDSCSSTGTRLTCLYTSGDGELDSVSVVRHEIPVTLDI